jgi:K+:H+ antiporter
MVLAAGPVTPIAAHQLLLFLLQLGLVLGTAGVLGHLAVRLAMPAVIGELAAGVLLGPSVLGQLAPSLSGWLLPTEVGQFQLLDAVGQLGLLLLVGITGMHINLGFLRRKGASVACVSFGGLIVPLVLGVGVGFLLPDSLRPPGTDQTVFALFIGVALGLSAIPVIAKTLMDMHLLHRDIGQLIIGAAAVNDIAGWLMLSVVSAMAVTGLWSGRLALTVVYLVAVLAIAMLAGRPVGWVMRRLTERGSGPGTCLALTVVLLMLCAAGTQALGLEAILGAFLVGILIGSSKQTDPAVMVPLRTFVMAVLAPIFFATAGLRMDLTALGQPGVLGSAIAVLLIAIGGKFAGAYLGARMGRLSHWEGLALGAGLNARGVIEVIVAMVGLRLGILSVAAYTIVVLVAIVTSLMAPATLRYAVNRIAVTTDERERVPALSG